MTIDHPLRRLLARVCSTETMSRIVDPTLADMRWEDGPTTVRGCTALVKALALHAVLALPGRCAAIWSDDDYALGRAVGFFAIASVLAGVVLMAPPLLQAPHAGGITFVVFAVLLLPQAFALSLPLAITVAIPLAFRRLLVNPRLIRRTLFLSGIVAAMTLAILTWALPNANQAFREAVYRALNGSRQVTLIRGPMETDWATLRQQIENLRRDADGIAAARLVYAYQLRLSIGVAAIPLGLAGLAISTFRAGRRRPLLTGLGLLFAYWALMMVEDSAAERLITTGGFFPEYLCPWTPNLIVVISATAILLSRRSLQPPTAPASRVA